MRPEKAGWADYAATAVIAVSVLALAAGLLASGTAVRADFDSADDSQPRFDPAAVEPEWLSHLWSGTTSLAGAPLVTRGNVVTADESGTLVGHRAGTGEEEWSYTHPGTLCGADHVGDVLVGVYDTGDGCGTVTALDTTAQSYSGTRMAQFPAGPDRLQLRSTADHLLALGPGRLEVWRPDLVRTIEYGEVLAPQEPDSQPREDCEFASAGLSDSRFAVSERCPGDLSQRLTVSTLVPEDSRIPEEDHSGETGADALHVLAVDGGAVLALEHRDGRWSVRNFVAPASSRPVLELDTDTGSPLLPGPETLVVDEESVLWFDGGATHAFDVRRGVHEWSVPGTTGPGLVLGSGPGERDEAEPGALVMMPVPGGRLVVDAETGENVRTLADPPGTGTSADTGGSAVTGSSQIGDVLYERRGDLVNAFKMCTPASEDPACDRTNGG